MPAAIQVGAIRIEEWPLMTQLFGLNSDPYSGKWSLVRALDCVSLDRKIHAEGWNFFFMATEVKTMFFGALGAKNIQNALKRILGKVTAQDFNCIEVTGIVAKRFLGVPYAIVTAHSRHIQKGCYLDSLEARRESQRDAARARG
jgi:hypothetical protein